MRGSVLIAAICFMLLSPFQARAADYVSIDDQYTTYGIIQCPKYLNIRQEPTTKSSVVGLIPNGGICEIKSKGDLWFAVKSGDISGYVLSQYVDTGDTAKELASELAVKSVRFNSLGSVYAAKSLDSKVWDTPITGSTYAVVDDEGDWITIDLDGATGYIPADSDVTYLMRLETAMPTYNLSYVDGQRSAVVKFAMQFLGKPYVWGGNDPNTGADCSGFVRYCFWHTANVWLPRVSYEQCYVGEKRTSMEMLPGDLIFYADQSGTVGHVALYIGNGTIIHAASSKSGVKLSQWNYRTPKYIRSVLP